MAGLSLCVNARLVCVCVWYQHAAEGMLTCCVQAGPAAPACLLLGLMLSAAGLHAMSSVGLQACVSEWRARVSRTLHVMGWVCASHAGSKQGPPVLPGPTNAQNNLISL